MSPATQSHACPGCKTTVTVPVGMASVRCPSCGSVWNVADPINSLQLGDRARAMRTQSHAKGRADRDSAGWIAAIAGIIGGIALLIAIGVGSFLVFRRASNAQAESKPEPASQGEVAPPPAAIVEANLPESERRRIYTDVRKVAPATTDIKVKIPKGSFARESFDGMMEGIGDRELRRFAALHNVELADIKLILAEGKAKGWD